MTEQSDTVATALRKIHEIMSAIEACQKQLELILDSVNRIAIDCVDCDQPVYTVIQMTIDEAKSFCENLEAIDLISPVDPQVVDLTTAVEVCLVMFKYAKEMERLVEIARGALVAAEQEMCSLSSFIDIERRSKNEQARSEIGTSGTHVSET